MCWYINTRQSRTARKGIGVDAGYRSGNLDTRQSCMARESSCADSCYVAWDNRTHTAGEQAIITLTDNRIAVIAGIIVRIIPINDNRSEGSTPRERKVVNGPDRSGNQDISQTSTVLKRMVTDVCH